MAIAKTKQTQAETAKEVGKFGIVGVLNTIIDFGVYNLLITFLQFAAIAANFVSTSIAMTFSFVANKQFVFGKKGGNVLKQALLFLLITAFGLYVLQNGVLYLLLNVWSQPLEWGYSVLTFLKLDTVFAREFAFNNGAKAAATGVSMTWNYFLYKSFVFPK